METQSGAYPTTTQGAESVRDFPDQVRRQLSDGMERMSETLAEYARKQPTTALLVAAGIGFIIGAVLGMGRR
ncbi:MAG TPA: hypothetical protein VFE48_24400 [Methylomirabilota bacterium]|jgi:ElaB/YqjD/DUF883 family membrane-anchored ribosome-binding protein|nr:hypothetical protein [Methylomirabilota bacterium]